VTEAEKQCAEAQSEDREGRLSLSRSGTHPVLALPPVTPRRHPNGRPRLFSASAGCEWTRQRGTGIRLWIRRQLQGNRKRRDLFSDAI
jgi:hypothetical protein